MTVRKIFDLNNPVLQFLSKVFDVAYLNILWVLTSLPLVTMGASTAAVHRATFRILTDRSASVTKGYFRAWKENWKQGTQIFFGLFLPAAIIGADIWFFTAVQQWLTGVPLQMVRVVLGVLLSVILMTATYAFPIQAAFENSLSGILKNALILALGNLGRSFLILLFDVGWLALTVLSLIYLPSISMLFLVFGVSLTVNVNMRIVMPVLRNYLPDELFEDRPSVAELPQAEV